MEKVTLSFSAKGQSLRGCLFRFASNTVNYIEAKFDLGENWGGFDSVRAVWFTDFNCISTVLDTDGVCVVPHEVLNKAKREVKVNLVGSIVEDGELTDRLTTYPIKAIIIDADAKICGSETAEVTPSQFEQYVEAVKAEVAKIKDIDSVELNDDYTLTIYFSDATETTIGPIRGEQGPAGPAGPQGETGNGIASIDKTGTAGYVDTYTITFTDGTTTTFEVRNGEVSLDTLESLMPVDTASGDIASFPDGQNLFPLKSLVADISPIQDLHGYDAPWVGGAGKNKCDEVFELGGIANGDGTNYSSSTNIRTTNYLAVQPNTTYYAFCGTSTNIYLRYYKADKTYISGIGQSVNAQFTTPSDCAYLRFYIDASYGTTYNHDIAINYPSTVTTYSPYENICPITGWTGCEVDVAGVNLLDVDDFTSAVDCGNDYFAGGRNAVSFSKAGTYTIKANTPSSGYLYARIKNADGTFLAFQPIIQSTTYETKTLTVADGQTLLLFDAINNTLATTKANVSGWSVQVETGSTATPYTPYNGQTYTTTLPSTTYGGTLDVVSGELKVDRAIMDLGSLTWGYSNADVRFYSNSLVYNQQNPNAVCSHYQSVPLTALVNGTICVYSNGYMYVKDSRYTDATAFKTAMNGVQLCYELATPQTYQLTPQQIQTLLGTNNVWANSGEVEVVYIADIKLYVDNH